MSKTNKITAKLPVNKAKKRVKSKKIEWFKVQFIEILKNEKNKVVVMALLDMLKGEKSDIVKDFVKSEIAKATKRDIIETMNVNYEIGFLYLDKFKGEEKAENINAIIETQTKIHLYKAISLMEELVKY